MSPNNFKGSFQQASERKRRNELVGDPRAANFSNGGGSYVQYQKPVNAGYNTEKRVK